MFIVWFGLVVFQQPSQVQLYFVVTSAGQAKLQDSLDVMMKRMIFYLLACLLFPQADAGTGLGGAPQEL